ncbi:subclass B1 metallo-beta-lactamase [Candidatus Kapabacteria bacterium]|nr:subclass B1 metallo-beta-lactamase [Candidatus Kapabacteria bacterium]
MKIIVLTILLVTICKSNKLENIIYKSERLEIVQISDNVYQHISYLEIPNYGKFPCNGLIFINNMEAIIFDTPVDDSSSAELLDWLSQKLKTNVIAIVINHFHNDCLGGIKEFHKNGIKSYASNKTIELAENNNEIKPQIGFTDSLELQVGKQITKTKYYGSGHTYDNVVSYIPTEKVLFGGCLIKSIGAGKGNLVDSDIEQWSKTVKLLKQDIAGIEIIVPGHGKFGGLELLDYTINLFIKQ